MTVEEKTIFSAVLTKLREQYPEKKINIIGDGKGNDFLTINDDICHNTTGYNLLYNLTMLCEAMKNN